ncbi:MAG: nuclear transport factor 2 family protein [Bacteroidia bacterium]|nr:nuclear transport factor 2 family protein [Bacteroidia bacterium]
MESRRQQIIEQYIEAYNTFDIGGMLAHAHPDLVFEHRSNGRTELRLEGADAFRRQAETARRMFRERRQTVTAWQAEGDTLTADIDYRAVLDVALPNCMRPGDLMQLKGQSCFTFDAGDRIIRIEDRS